MKWAYSIQQKFKAAVLLAIVCVIILITNILGRYHMGVLSNSFSSLYEDRLVVESYIYKISDHLYQKKLAFDNCNELTDSNVHSTIGSHNEVISNLLLFYENTLLTEEEAICLEDFKGNIAALQNLELQQLQSSNKTVVHTTTRNLFNEHFALASANLRQLSQIQIQEGKALSDHSRRIVYGSSLLTNITMVILICITIILQIIVLTSRPVITRPWQQSNLN